MRSLANVVVISFFISCIQTALGQNVIISQYVEGSSYNKAIVIKNTDPSLGIILSNIKLQIAFNGGQWEDFYQGDENKELQAGTTFTLCNPQASELLLTECDALTGSVNFNGNDALRLLTKQEGDSWVMADEIGSVDSIGTSKGWNIGNINEATYDHTILRKASITEGSTWNASEWSVLSKDTLYSNYKLVCLAAACESGDPDNSSKPSETCDHATNSDHKHKLNSLKIATFNVEWLFDGVDDPKMSPWSPGADNCPGMKDCGSAAGAQDHIREISKIIQKLDADILNLAEVENCGVLSAVKDLVSQDYFSYLTPGTDTYTRQNVALLSKFKASEDVQRISSSFEFPISGSKCGYTGKSKNTTVSKNYMTRFKINDITVAFYGVHFKAIPTDPYSCAKREGQAKIIQAAIKDSIARGEEVVVFGDMNDFSDLYKDSNSDVPTSRVLRILRDIDDDGEDELVNAMHFMKESDRYTSWYDRNRDDNDNGGNEHSQIDHILMSRKLSLSIKSVSIDHSYDPALVSDHWPVTVHLKFKDAEGDDYVDNGDEDDDSRDDSTIRYVVMAGGIVVIIGVVVFGAYYMHMKNRAEEALVFM